MNNQRNVSHEEWDELAAAYALDALGPSESQRLTTHAATCGRCQRNLDDYALIAAQLGSLADDEEPAPSWQRVRSHVIAEDVASEPAISSAPEKSAAADNPVLILPAPRRWRPSQLLVAAASVVLLITGGVVGWQLGTRSSPSPAAAAVDACRQQPGCRVVPLRDARAGAGTADRAAVVVDAGRASLVPMKMAAPPVARMYVLWQMPRDGSPVAIVSLRQTDRHTPSSALRAPYDDTAAFAVSLELTGVTPDRPSDILALGAAPA